jgi:hypothetical protein
LIDTDGTIQDNVYDITQKNVQLSKDIRELARGLGMYSQIVERTAKATNSPTGAVGVYQRVFIYMSKSSPEIPLLLERKMWDKEVKHESTHGIRIKLKKVQETFRHEWTQERKDAFPTIIPKYTTVFGVVQWGLMQQSEPLFHDFSPDALRKYYTVNKKTMPKNNSDEFVRKIKAHFIKVLPQYQTAKGSIRWGDLMKEDVFKDLTMQQMRTMMTKLTKEEQAQIQATIPK